MSDFLKIPWDILALLLKKHCIVSLYISFFYSLLSVFKRITVISIILGKVKNKIKIKDARISLKIRFHKLIEIY